MPLPTTIMDRSFGGGTLAAGNNDSDIFTLRSGHGIATLVHVKDAITSFIVGIWILADDGATWTQLYDTSNAVVSVFGTISASVTGRSRGLWMGGPGLPVGVPMKLVAVVTGTPAGNDSIRIGLAQAA